MIHGPTGREAHRRLILYLRVHARRKLNNSPGNYSVWINGFRKVENNEVVDFGFEIVMTRCEGLPVFSASLARNMKVLELTSNRGKSVETRAGFRKSSNSVDDERFVRRSNRNPIRFHQIEIQ
jgi:hypothetical protein